MPDPKDLLMKRTMLKLYSDFSPEVKALMALPDKVMVSTTLKPTYLSERFIVRS